MSALEPANIPERFARHHAVSPSHFYPPVQRLLLPGTGG
jgi:hypothetical protein